MRGGVDRQARRRCPINRRTFLKRAASASALIAAGPLASSAYAKRGDDTPRPGTKRGYDHAIEAHGGPIELPPWRYGDSSTGPDAMLMFRGNPSHTFYGTGTLPSQPKILWKYRMEDFESLYYGTPHVWRGTGWTGQATYLAGYIFVGSQGRSIYAFEAESGKLRWRFRAKRQIKASICLYDNRIYVGSVDDWLRCVDARDGHVIWRVNTGRDLDSSACVVGDKLYIAGENGHARCLNPHTGELIWKTFVGGINRGKKTGSYGSETSPAVVDGEYYCATYDGDLFQLDAATGAVNWKAKTYGDTDASPVVVGDYVYTAAEEEAPYVYCFAREDGRQIWKRGNHRGFWSTPAVVGDTLYISGFNSRLYALDAKTGADRWIARLHSPSWSSPAVVDGVAIVGTFDGRLIAFDIKTGAEAWTVRLGGKIHSTPIVIDGRIYIGTGRGYFYALG